MLTFLTWYITVNLKPCNLKSHLSMLPAGPSKTCLEWFVLNDPFEMHSGKIKIEALNYPY